MRQTDLSFEDLLAKVANPTQGKKCFFINEIGCILWEDKEKVGEAEAFLRGLLDSHDPEERFYAFCYLSTTKKLDPVTSLKLEEFKKNPDNEWVLREAEDAIENPRLGALG